MALDRDGAPQCTTFPTEEGETAIRRSPAIVAPTSSAIMYGITSFAGIFFPNSSPIVTAGLRAPPEIPIVMEIPIARPSPFARAATRSADPGSNTPTYWVATAEPAPTKTKMKVPRSSAVYLLAKSGSFDNSGVHVLASALEGHGFLRLVNDGPSRPWKETASRLTPRSWLFHFICKRRCSQLRAAALQPCL